MLAILIIANLIMLILLGIGFIYLRRITQRRFKIQEKLHKSWSTRIPHLVSFPVRACNEKRFLKTLKLFPWDLTGQLFIGQDNATLLLVDKHNKGIKRTLTYAKSNLRWIGQKFWPNGKWHWFSVLADGQTYYLTSESGLTVINSGKSTRTIFDNLVNRFGSNATAIEEPPEPFSLDKHPVSLAMLIIFFSLVAYGILDTFFINEEEYITYPFLWLSLLAGGVVLILSMFWALAGKIPKAEASVLAILLALAAGCCIYPGMLRLNQVTAETGPIPYVYRVQYENNLLAPNDQLLPQINLNMKMHKEFWQEIGPEEAFIVELRKGGLGFYQVNMTPIYDQLQAFYRQRHKAGKG